MSEKELKFCKDCKWSDYRAHIIPGKWPWSDNTIGSPYYMCVRRVAWTSLVDGTEESYIVDEFCEDERSLESRCGEEGAYWEKRIPHGQV